MCKATETCRRRRSVGACDEPADQAFIGSADIQSLADLGGACERVGAMRLAPISREAVLAVAAATLTPIAPLVLTMIPLDELLKKLLSVVF